MQRRRTLDHVLSQLGGREPADLEPAVRDTLRLGAYQLLYTDGVPPHAAVATSVDLVREARRPGAAGLVNAILRRVARSGADLVAALPDETAADAALRRSYPDWIAELWFDAYGGGGGARPDGHRQRARRGGAARARRRPRPRRGRAARGRRARSTTT